MAFLFRLSGSFGLHARILDDLEIRRDRGGSNGMLPWRRLSAARLPVSSAIMPRNPIRGSFRGASTASDPGIHNPCLANL